jgi:hypothetical protein
MNVAGIREMTRAEFLFPFPHISRIRYTLQCITLPLLFVVIQETRVTCAESILSRGYATDTFKIVIFEEKKANEGEL